MKRLEADLAALDDSAIDRVRHRSETQFVPEASIRRNSRSDGEGPRDLAAGEGGLRPARTPRFLLGHTIGSLQDAVLSST